MEIKILITCLFLFVLASGQSGVHKSYDWRTTGRLQEWPKLTSLLPYEHQVVTENYPGRYHDSSSAYHDDSRHYPEDPYSSEYHDPSPYQYPNHVDQGLSNYEQPYGSHPQEQLNMTMVRIGGFAGTGDTRGFGAYDFPKKNHHEGGHQDRPMLQSELADLLKIGQDHHSGYHNPDPMLMHPLPPPL